MGKCGTFMIALPHIIIVVGIPTKTLTVWVPPRKAFSPWGKEGKSKAAYQESGSDTP